jgi:aminoglycoside 6'-N-acetyltransferase
MTVTLRPATPADIPLLSDWDSRPHVMACMGADAPPDWEEDFALLGPDFQILIGEAAGRPVGVVQIIDPAAEPTHYWGDCEQGLRAIDIWIGEEKDLGRGLGTQIMSLAIARCFQSPDVTAILIDPLERNTAAQRFYARLGFQIVGPRRFGEDDCVVMRLERASWARGG